MTDRINLFVYGTLCSPQVQMELFDYEPPSVKAVLEDHQVYEDADGYRFVTQVSGERTEGMLLTLTERDIVITDLWEDVPMYVREDVTVQTANGSMNAQVYYKTNVTAFRACSEGVSAHSLNNVIQIIKQMKASDIYTNAVSSFREDHLT